MHSTRSSIVPVLVGFALLIPSLVPAQDWSQPWADPQDRPGRVDVSASLGFLAPTDWSDLVLLGSISSATGALEQVLVRDLRVEPDKEYGGLVTYWQGRYGLRVQLGFSSSSIAMGGRLLGAPSAASDRGASIDVDTWLYDLGAAIGFVEYSPELWIWPYGFFGFGGVTYDLARRVSPPITTFIEQGPPGADGRRDVVFVEDDSLEFLLAIDELDTETVFAWNFGVGTDFRIPLPGAGIGVRLELADHVTTSPVALRVSDFRRSGALASDTGVEFAPVHHLRASVGFVLQFGR
jgi:hypothetical protein